MFRIVSLQKTFTEQMKESYDGRADKDSRTESISWLGYTISELEIAIESIHRISSVKFGFHIFEDMCNALDFLKDELRFWVETPVERYIDENTEHRTFNKFDTGCK